MGTLKAVWTQRKHVIIFTTIMLLYSLGGGGWKFLRRFALPTVIALAIPLRVWRRVILALCLAVPLHFGYTGMIDSRNWLMIALLGAGMGLSWLPAAQLRTGGIMIGMAAIFVSSVILSVVGLNWQFCELLVGLGYAISYLICIQDDPEVWHGSPSSDDFVSMRRL